MREMEGEVGGVRERGERERRILEEENEILRGKGRKDYEDVLRLKREVDTLCSELSACRNEVKRQTEEKKLLEKECRKLCDYIERKKKKTEKAVENMYRDIVGGGSGGGGMGRDSKN